MPAVKVLPAVMNPPPAKRLDVVYTKHYRIDSPQALTVLTFLYSEFCGTKEQ